MRLGISVMGLVIAGTLFFLGACSLNPKKPNILLITIDTLRSDHCSSYGYGRPTTPLLERLASEGTRFEVSYAISSTTAPSHATLFTGTHPLTHRVMKNGYALGKEIPLLAEVLQSHGYETAAFVSSFVLHKRFGFARGLATYNDRFDRSGASVRWGSWKGIVLKGGFDQRADRTTEKALRWLQQRPASASTPFFLWIHYYDPHLPYDPPKQYRSLFSTGDSAQDLEKEINLYDGEIRFVDDQMGRLFEFLDQNGMKKNTLAVVTSDHGEAFLEHGNTGHGKDLYEESVRVPLIFRWPGQIREGNTVTAPVGIIDIAPTLNALLKLEMSDLQGASLASFLKGKSAEDPDRKIFLHRRRFADFTGDMFGVRWKNYKVVEARGMGLLELYDLERDPGERNNIAPSSPGALSQLVGDLQRWETLTTRRDTGSQEITPEDEEALNALGYVQ